MADKSSNINDLLESEISQMVATRYNVVTGVVEYSKDKGEIFLPMTDFEERSILRSLKNNGFKGGIDTVRNILNSDFSTPYNPFVTYFESLPEWDGDNDYIKQFCNFVDVENDKYWIEWVTKWLVSMVVGSIDPKIVNHQVLVLAGGQGIGKTTWLNHIVPTTLEKYANTGYVNPESKDALIQASECILVNIDELSSLNKKSLEGFKQLVTQVKIKIRKPYGFNPENLIKRASFCGSTNDNHFLTDPSGNRRFLSFIAKDIDLDGLAKFNMDKVFSQAYSLYQSGMQYWFSKKENKLIEANNIDFISRSVEEEALMSKFEPCDKDDVAINIFKWTASEVMISLASHGLISSSPSSAQRVGKALVSLGFYKYKSNGRLLYKLRAK